MKTRLGQRPAFFPCEYEDSSPFLYSKPMKLANNLFIDNHFVNEETIRVFQLDQNADIPDESE